jgi:hypothetical protein
MKTKHILAYICVIMLMALALGGSALAQEPEPPEGPPPTGPAVPAEFPMEVDEGSEGITEPDVPAAQVPYTMNYQGYLTDGGGNPLDGTYNLALSLWDAATGGNREWGPEMYTGVQVTRGLFHVVMGLAAKLYPDDFDEALFLKVVVNGTPMASRQPVRSVAYAFGLVPGAEVDGEPSSGQYALTVRNSGGDSNDRGLFAYGREYGIYAEEIGSGDVGIYSPDFVQARGYKSNLDSYLWVPGIAGVVATFSYTYIQPISYGKARLTSKNPGHKYFYIPVNTPSLLYGQEVTVEELTVYYQCEDSASYILETRLEKLEGASSHNSLIYDPTHRNSTTESTYSLAPSSTSDYILDASSGPLTVRLKLSFSDNSHHIDIGAVRLRLGHTDPP